MAGDPLQVLGWDDAWDHARHNSDPSGSWQPVRIAAEHRGAYHALGPAPGGLATAWVELTGKTFHQAADKRALPVVGDWVLVERWPAAVGGTGAGVIRALLPRRTLLVRKAAGEATLPQPLVANVDAGVVLTSANSDLSPARLDRYIGLLRDGGIEPVFVLSKIDLIDDPSSLVTTLGTLGVDRVLAVSSLSGAGITELRAVGGAGRTCVLLGSSGVGKSTLLNALVGARQLTQPIRDDDRGRHTTTRRELFVAEDGALWIDTPGMRELAQWLDGDEPAFDDITALAASCKFRDCQHQAEPGCAVRGTIDPARLASFHKLQDERARGVAKQRDAAKLTASRKARGRKPAPSDQ